MRSGRSLSASLTFIISLAGVLALPSGLLQAQGFGQAVLVAGDEVLVGESLYTTRPGYVYIYRKDGSGAWTEAARLQASDAEPNDHFGRALALAGGDLLVGATIARESGALYVFRRGSDGSWREVQSMVPSNAHPDQSFGRMAATDGRTVLMSDWAADSSRGAVYVFEKQGDEWRETAKLAASDGQQNDWFGYSVAVDGDRIAIGARNRTRNRGIVYIFRRNGGQWTEAASILPAEEQPNLFFGAAVEFAGEELLIGATGANQFVGSIYVYRSGQAGWTEAGRIAPPIGMAPSNSFASTLHAVGDEIWAGAPGIETGRVFRLSRAPDGQWQHLPPLDASGLSAGDGFGGALDVRGAIAAAGVIGDDFGLGSVILLERQGSAWTRTGQVLSEAETLDPVTGNRVDCRGGEASTFGCTEIDLLSFLPVKEIGGARGVQLNDVWGWTDPETGREWAIVGRMDGTSFIDVSDPVNPVYAGDLPMHQGSQPNSWRDIKVYKDHSYIVADGAGPHGVQVFDLTRLRRTARADMPVKFTEDAHYANVASAHNIVINENAGFAYAVGSNSGGETCGGGLHMIDIREPKTPKFAGCFQDTETGIQRTGYSHDAQCVTYRGPDEAYRGREICLGSNETMLSISDVTDKEKPLAISRAAYPDVGYAHQGWFDDRHEFFYMNDEGDETAGTVERTRTLVWDLRDLDDPVLAKEHFGVTSSSDHNLYIRGNLMYQSNYVSGLRILDISDPTAPREVGFFDTVPGENVPGFDGSWSNYPFFASGTIVITSMKEGVFMLRQKSRAVS
ncbi:MAG: choice-of-anchor B family protein [Gemmatimonadetes bacterium]|nr:choice-of-anchor B family protein [Gemmatimonadota bacterium]